MENRFNAHYWGIEFCQSFHLKSAAPLFFKKNNEENSIKDGSG
jgi:hypothetical protein